jgi:hypothetical protein
MPLPAQNRCLVICTGSGAWAWGKSPCFHPGYKVVLPPGDDPGAYEWRIVCGSDALIFGFGEPEPLDVIARLGALLLTAGATLVVYCPERGPLTRIDARRPT